MAVSHDLNVVLLVFNRPELTERVMQQVRLARPRTLLVVADGPRPDVPEDAAKCVRVREIVQSGLSPEVRLLTNFAESNMGLRQRVSSGLTWVFEQVDRAIILEDDCVPEPTFFPFCAELLEKFADDSRIGAITGNNFQAPDFACETSYYFSKYPHCWGWATWRRAWKLFDGPMKHWPAMKERGFLRNLFADEADVAFWEKKFERVYRGEINSWAFPWTFSNWSQNMLSIIPRKNLVTNVGFGDGATNTRKGAEILSELPVYPMQFPLRHPECVSIDYQADLYTQRNIYFRRPAAPAPEPTPAQQPQPAPRRKSFFGRLIGS